MAQLKILGYIWTIRYFLSKAHAAWNSYPLFVHIPMTTDPEAYSWVIHYTPYSFRRVVPNQKLPSIQVISKKRKQRRQNEKMVNSSFFYFILISRIKYIKSALTMSWLKGKLIWRKFSHFLAKMLVFNWNFLTVLISMSNSLFFVVILSFLTV